MHVTCPHEKFCPPMYDGYLCWSPTGPGTVLQQQCPADYISDTRQKAFKECDKTGHWARRKVASHGISEANWWTNYSACFPDEIYYRIASYVRFLEIIGYALSCVSLVLTAVIYCCAMEANNERLIIHRFMFTSIIAQFVLTLMIFYDQVNLYYHQEYSMTCPAVYILYEQTVSCTHAWMLIEAIHSNNLLHKNNPQRCSNKLLLLGSCILPTLVTGVWAWTSNSYFAKKAHSTCWYGYNLLPIYWLLEGPRLICLTMNFIYIILILITTARRRRRGETSKGTRFRKTVWAVFFLLSFFGLLKFFKMVQPPIGNVLLFVVWTFASHFFRSLEMFFLCLTYCFLNDEVQKIINKLAHNLAVYWVRKRPTAQRQPAFDEFGVRRRRFYEDIELVERHGAAVPTIAQASTENNVVTTEDIELVERQGAATTTIAQVYTDNNVVTTEDIELVERQGASIRTIAQVYTDNNVVTTEDIELVERQGAATTTIAQVYTDNNVETTTDAYMDLDDDDVFFD